MELSEAIEILKEGVVNSVGNEITGMAESPKEYTQAVNKVLQELEKLQKENELARKTLIENSHIADERNNLLVEVQQLRKENEELKNIDLTTVHIKGVCDEKERWRNKIKEKIEETRSKMHKFESDNANRLYLEHFNNNYYNKQSKKYGVFNTQEVITHCRLQEYVIKMGALQELLKGE